jgi:hypothetical protein
MVRFLLRSPLLWIGMLVAAYISWLWLKSTAQPIGFSYSRGGLQIVVAAGGDRFSFRVGRDPQPGAGSGFEMLVPGHFGAAYYLCFFAQLGSRGRPVWFGGSLVSLSFRALLGGYLALWYGFLGWRAWRYHRRHAVLVEAAIQPPAGA